MSLRFVQERRHLTHTHLPISCSSQAVNSINTQQLRICQNLRRIKNPLTGRASFELMFCTRCCSLVFDLLPRLGNIINSKLLSPKHTIGCPTKVVAHSAGKGLCASRRVTNQGESVRAGKIIVCCTIQPPTPLLLPLLC